MTILLHPLLRLQRAAQLVGEQLRAVEGGAGADVHGLGDRVRPGGPEAQGARGEGRRGRHELRHVAVGDRDGALQVVDVGVRVGVRDAVYLLEGATVQVDGDALTRAEEVGVRVAAVQHELVGLGVTDAAGELRRRALLDLVVHVHQVRGSRHRRGLEIHALDVRQALDALLGALERGIRQPAALELAHLTAQHLVVDAVGAAEADVTHVHAVARVDEEGERHRVIGVVGGGHRLDLGEGIAVAPHAILHQFLRRGDQLAVEGRARVYQQQLLELALRHDERARQLDLRHLVDLALIDVHGDEDVFLLRSDRHLGRIQLEVRVTAIHVEVAHLLQVTLQRLARVAVVLPVPGQPVGRLQLERLQNLFLWKSGRAHDVDLADLGARAFLDLDLDLHAVARLLLHVRVDLHAVLAAGEVLVGEILGNVLEHRAVEGLAGREPDVAQRLLQILGLDVLVTGDLEALDGRALQHHDNERAAVAAQLHVAEEAGGVQSADRLAHALRREVIADVHRQVVVDRALGDALQTLDADVADGEVRRARRRLRKCQRAPRRQRQGGKGTACFHSPATDIPLERASSGAPETLPLRYFEDRRLTPPV